MSWQHLTVINKKKNMNRNEKIKFLKDISQGKISLKNPDEYMQDINKMLNNLSCDKLIQLRAIIQKTKTSIQYELNDEEFGFVEQIGLGPYFI
jgi:hypothetical protein